MRRQARGLRYALWFIYEFYELFLAILRYDESTFEEQYAVYELPSIYHTYCLLQSMELFYFLSKCHIFIENRKRFKREVYIYLRFDCLFVIL